MKPYRHGALLLLTLAAGAALAGPAAQPETKTLQQPELYYLDHYDVSPPLRDLPALPPESAADRDALNDHPVKRIRVLPPLKGPVEDPLAGLSRRAALPNVGTTAGLSFDGVGVGLGSFSPSGAPPDTNGAAGATQYVQWVNTSFAVFNKSTGALVYGPVAGNTIWQGFGGACQNNNDGDPVVMYDKAAQRWIMTQFSVTNGFYQCVAVSTTSDATGSYRRFAYNFTNFDDYPKGGVWPDGYYLTFNMFNAAGTAFLGAQVCALDRLQMITASGTPGPIQCFQLSSTYGGLLPADLDGATPPPSGAPNYVMAFDDVNNNGLNLWKFHVDWATPASSTLTGPTKITTASFTPACNGGTCIAQSGTTQQLDSLADRLMFRLAYRNFGDHEALVVTHSVTAGSAASGVRWYEVRNPGGTPSVFQQGTFSPDATARWMGSAAMDQQGNLLMGYSASSSSVKPGIRYTGRLAGDAAGTLQAENTLLTGAGAQTGGLSRWGDYSSMTIDPSDDCTFWFTTEYLKTNGSYNWSTRIASFKFPSCGSTPTPDFSVSCSPSSLSAAQGGSATSTCTVTSTGGFASAVSLSCAGLPAGATCGFSPASVTPPANGSSSSALTVTVAGSTAIGSYSFSVNGVNGSTTRSASLSLSVTGTGPGDVVAAYDATLKAPKCGTLGRSCDSGASLLLGRNTKGPEPNYPNTVNTSCADGASGTFHSDESNDRLKVSTTDGSAFAPGKTVRIDATVWAYSSYTSDKLDLYYAANASSPTWTFLTTLTPTAAGAGTLSATYTLPSGSSLQAVRARFRYTGTAGACGTGSYDDHDDLVFTVNVPPPTPDFSLACSPASLSATQGGSASSTCTVTSTGGFASAVSLACAGLPAGATCAFSPASVTPPANGSGTSALTVSVASSTPLGSIAFTVNGTSGSTTRSANLTLNVTGTAGDVAAAYDATLKAPKCTAVGRSCDSGASLVLGRSTKGPEPNYPNTINASCADGTSGTFHSDESNDRLKVSTTDGSAFAPGKTVRIDATVWAYSSYTSDKLDLYYAANASSPTWTFLTTLTPTAAGAGTLSATYTLPSGTLQAVRAQFRYGGSAGTCSTGGYNDRDDLVFAVNP